MYNFFLINFTKEEEEQSLVWSILHHLSPSHGWFFIFKLHSFGGKKLRALSSFESSSTIYCIIVCIIKFASTVCIIKFPSSNQKIYKLEKQKKQFVIFCIRTAIRWKQTQSTLKKSLVIDFWLSTLLSLKSPWRRVAATSLFSSLSSTSGKLTVVDYSTANKQAELARGPQLRTEALGLLWWRQTDQTSTFPRNASFPFILGGDGLYV